MSCAHKSASAYALMLSWALALSACWGGGGPPPPTQADLPKGVDALGAGDVIEIRVFREPDLAGVYRVSDEGSLDFPLIGEVRVSGRQPQEVAEELRARLADGYLVDPQVSVFVKERNSQKVHVLGQVNKPGSFAWEPAMSVIQAITNAGGFTKLAATNRVQITRKVAGREQAFTAKVGAIRAGDAPNVQLRPGDIVYVPESLF